MHLGPAPTPSPGPGPKAAFESKDSSWLGPSGDKPVLPKAQQLQAAGP